MKLVDQSQDVLIGGPTRIATALSTSATSITSVTTALPGQLASATQSLVSDFGAIVSEMATIPGLLNPQPVVSGLTEGLATVVSEMKSLAAKAEGIPKRLLDESVNKVTPLLAEVRNVQTTVVSMPSKLLALVPDVSSALSAQQQHYSELLNIAKQALSVVDLVEGLGAGLNRSIASQADPASLQSQFATAQTQLQSLQASLADRMAQKQVQFDEASLDIGGSLTAALDGLDAGLDEMVAPLRAVVDRAGEVVDSLTAQSGTCDQLFEDVTTSLGTASDALKKPVETAEGQLDAVSDKVAQVGGQIEALLKKALEPIDLVQNSADQCFQAVFDAQAAVQKEVDGVKSLLAEIDVLAENTKTQLNQVPEHFNLVREQINNAIDQITRIRDTIPSFVAQALAALSAASDELDQASVLCDKAIEVCTRYMMKAPLLIPARLLFLGVKTAIPGIKAMIATAKTTVETAGKTATSLLNQAIAAVQALHPVLDQVVERVKGVIAQLIVLIEKLQDALKTVGAKLDEMMQKLDEAIKAIPPRVQELVDKVKSTADTYLQKAQPQPAVDAIQQKISELKEQVFPPIYAQLDPGTGVVFQAVNTAQQKLGELAAQLGEKLRMLHAQLEALLEQAIGLADPLRDSLASARQVLEELRAQEQTQREALTEKLSNYFGDAAQQMSNLLGSAMEALPAKAPTTVAEGA